MQIREVMCSKMRWIVVESTGDSLSMRTSPGVRFNTAGTTHTLGEVYCNVGAFETNEKRVSMAHLDCSHTEQGGPRHKACNDEQSHWRRIRLDQRYDDVPAKAVKTKKQPQV